MRGVYLVNVRRKRSMFLRSFTALFMECLCQRIGFQLRQSIFRLLVSVRLPPAGSGFMGEEHLMTFGNIMSDCVAKDCLKTCAMVKIRYVIITVDGSSKYKFCLTIDLLTRSTQMADSVSYDLRIPNPTKARQPSSVWLYRVKGAFFGTLRSSSALFWACPTAMPIE